MNDIKKLIQVLKEHQKSYIGHDYIFYEIKFCNPRVQMCIEALEKQASRKVNEIMQYESILDGYCPCCQRYITSILNYCPDCGQCLDWEVENE